MNTNRAHLKEEVMHFKEDIVCLKQKVLWLKKQVTHLKEKVMCLKEEVTHLKEKVVLKKGRPLSTSRKMEEVEHFKKVNK